MSDLFYRELYFYRRFLSVRYKSHHPVSYTHLDGAIVYAGDIQWDEPDHWTCAVAEKYQTKVIPVLLDVTDREMVKKTLMGIHKQEGRIDCVVNNAAIISNQKLGMVLRENLEQMYLSLIHILGRALSLRFISRGIYSLGMASGIV